MQPHGLHWPGVGSVGRGRRGLVWGGVHAQLRQNWVGGLHVEPLKVEEVMGGQR